MRILVISAGESDEVRDLQIKARELGHELTVENITHPEEALKDSHYDVVYWRSASITKQHKKTVGRSIAMQRLQSGAPIVNEVLIREPLTTSKAYQQEYISHQAPHQRGITTYIAHNKEVLQSYIKSGKLAYPFIAKPDTGSQGRGVLLIEKEEELNGRTLSEYVFQNYIPNDCDYRVFVVGGVAVDVVRRRATDASEKSYLNNISRGGAAEKVADRHLYYRLARKAESIAAVFGLTVSGVDLIQHSETGEIHFMEINSVPQWVCFKSALQSDIGKEIIHTLVALGRRKEKKNQILKAADIRACYDEHIRYAPPSQTFHYCSRLHLWSNGELFTDELADLKSSWIPDPGVFIRLAKSIKDASPRKRLGGRPYRKAAYEKFFKIYRYNRIFFKALFLREIYHDDTYKELIGALDREDVQRVHSALLEDHAAILSLSTHAVNFLYHAQDFLGLCVQPELLLDIGEREALDDVLYDTEAHIYMYTHAIIGASRFYTKRKNVENSPVYLEMMRRIETIFASRYPVISLDQKCEAVVCGNLLGTECLFKEAVKTEIGSSASLHGDFAVDTQNVHNRKGFKGGFLSSEHRNVLAIMAFDGHLTKDS